MKWLALILMTLDHIAVHFRFLLPGELFLCLRILGRLAFPMFAYQVALGYTRTHNCWRYLIRLVSAAVITQAAMELTASSIGGHTYINVLFTLSLGLLTCIGLDLIQGSFADKKHPMFSNRMTESLIGAVFLIGAPLTAFVLKPDFELFGVLCILFSKIVRDHRPIFSCSQSISETRRTQLLLATGLMTLTIAWLIYRQAVLMESRQIWIQLFGVLAVLLFPALSKTRKSGRFGKYCFYAYYPAHLCAIMFLSAKISEVLH